MSKIPFSVSARTARLIGRENVSNAEGAIIELVKNAYDADASTCIVFFKKDFSGIPEQLSIQEYTQISTKQTFKEIKDCYEKNNEGYQLKTLIGDKTEVLSSFFNSLCEIYIIDNGTGMTRNVLENQWMMIGTDNKLENYISKKKRIQTGAKGIGRFALDRLGSFCEVLTKSEDSSEGYKWAVNWENFEKKNTDIGKIYAELEVVQKFSSDSLSFFKKTENEVIMPLLGKFEHGTILRIKSLSDTWNSESITNIYHVLESLTPPGTFQEFKMFVFNSEDLNAFGEVKNFINDDFDYQVNATFNSEKQLNIKISRREFDYKKIDKKLFLQKEMQKSPYTEEDFKKGYFLIKMDIHKLLPGGLNEYILNNLGPFEFNFYFIKRQTTNEDREVFSFRDFNQARRAEWLDRSSGIKIFRDNFRIRPYGEPKGSTYDWLGLDMRAAKSPAGFAQRIGQWHVRSYQVAGEVNISRITNIYFDDKSSREGLQENAYFKVFKNILNEIVALFERDREYIGINMKSFSKKNNEEEKTKEEAHEIAEMITSTPSSPQQSLDIDPQSLKQQLETVSKGFKIKEKEQEELLTEAKMLRTLASSGLLVATFAHELRQLGGTLSRRVDLLEQCLEGVIDKSKLASLPTHLDPYKRLQRLRDDDLKLKNWIDLSVNTLQRNKRDLIKINLTKYLSEYIEYVNNIVKFKEAHIEFKSTSDDIEIKVFPIDMDSIFNNLLANSIAGFLRKDAPNERKISINISATTNNVIIEYLDSGPGLDSSIPYPEKIYDLFFTTKINEVGEKIGTGLGMWIVKSIIEEYEGSINITKVRPGFGIKMEIPKHISK